MQVEIRQQPELRVGAVRHVGPYGGIAEAFERLHVLAGPAPRTGLASALVAIYHDDPRTTPAEALRSDAGLVLPAGTRLPPGLAEQRLPAGRYACATFTGPYDRLGERWAWIMGEWLPQHGERPASGLCHERYLNTPAEVEREELVTELWVQLA